MAKRLFHPGFPSDLRDAILHFDGISPGSAGSRKTNDEFRLTIMSVWFLPGTPLFYHHLHPTRLGKIILGDLGIENGKLRMENY